MKSKNFLIFCLLILTASMLLAGCGKKAEENIPPVQKKPIGGLQVLPAEDEPSTATSEASE
jgi:hypothetical protein